MTYKVFIVCGPSGIGKTHVFTTLESMYPGKITHTAVHTTRKPRTTEKKTPTGRTFVSTDTFLRMASNNEFVIHENFANNYYGYTRQALTPDSNHIIIDVSPWLLPQLHHLTNAVFIGMTPAEHFLPELQKRISNRGDSALVVAERMPYIYKDISDIATQTELIERMGKVFVIQNNDTLHNEVIPYISELMND